MDISSDITTNERDLFWITQARIPTTFLRDDIAALRNVEDCVLANVQIRGGYISAIEPCLEEHASPVPSLALSGRHLWPALVDIHTHIDKSQVIDRLGALDGSFGSAREAIAADRIRFWTRDDIRERMDFSIRCAHAHGVAALRTHIDSYEGQAELSWDIFSELRETWAGRVQLQAAASVPIDVFATDYGRRLADLAAATDGGLLGGVLRRSAEPDYNVIDNIDDLLDAQFTLAKERGLAIDLHVDETISEAVCHLENVAKATMRHRLEGRVVCSHCCSLAVQSEEKLASVLALCAEAGIGIVTLPLTNCHLQDRKLGRTPRLRGVAPVHEIGARGISVAMASDNVRDALFPFGDYDLVDTFRHAVPIYHLDQCLMSCLAILGPAPSAMMGLPPLGSLAVGAPAHMIIFNAHSIREIVSRSQADRLVLSFGRAISDAVPRNHKFNNQ